MNNSKLLQSETIGTAILAICRLTPVLVVFFGALGLSALIGMLDELLLPAIVIFIAITVYALWKRKAAA